MLCLFGFFVLCFVFFKSLWESFVWGNIRNCRYLKVIWVLNKVLFIWYGLEFLKVWSSVRNGSVGIVIVYELWVICE